MIGRRALLKSAIAFAAAVASPVRASSGARKRILVLGGTNFVGPHVIHSALRSGHEVTLFNRGITNPQLFPGVEKLRGDRMQADGLAALGHKREWDVVIDTWAKAPRAVEASAQLLKGRAGTYAYVSSIAVYGSFRKIGLNEADPILSLAKRPTGDGDVGYVWAKRLGEEAVQRHFPNAHLIARGSSILGFDSSADPQNQSLYWPLRIRGGGEILAPGDGNDFVQYTDVGSIADFIVGSTGEVSGAFNVASAPITMRQFLETAVQTAGSDAALTWVPQDFLIANGGTPFEKVPMWIPKDDAEPGFYQFDTARAHAAGMPACELHKTVSAILTAFADRPRDWQPDWAKVGGMPAELERSILNKWRGRAS